MFLIDACAVLHIAMESRLELIFKKGNITGKYRDTNKKTALRYICEEFGENYRGGKYFEDYYKDRIIIVHPEPDNDLGQYSQPPIEPDDFYDLYENMISIYVFILIDYKNFLWEKNPNY